MYHYLKNYWLDTIDFMFIIPIFGDDTIEVPLVIPSNSIMFVPLNNKLLRHLIRTKYS